MTFRSNPCLLFALALAYLLSAIAIAALLAYPVYQLIDLKVSFPRLVNRLGLGLLILGIFPLRKIIGLSAAEMGFPDDMRIFFKQLVHGFGIGLAILALVIFVLIALEVRTTTANPFDNANLFMRHLCGAFASGVLVALAEEPLFRGLLFGAATKYGKLLPAFFITAFFYAGLHFISGRGEVSVDQLHWLSGLELVPPALLRIFEPSNLDSFAALFVVSLFLTTVLSAKPRGIGYCIGLHASWVFLLKLTKRYTEVVPDSPWHFLVGSYDGIIGYLVALWLLLVTFAYQFRISRSRNAPPASCADEPA